MNTKNYLTPTRRYKLLISATHSVFRLINSTFDHMNLVMRLTRLIAQIFHADYCSLMLLDPSQKYCILKFRVSKNSKQVVEKKAKIKDRLSCRIIRTLQAVKKERLLGVPLIGEDLVGIIVLRRSPTEPDFDKFELEILMTILEQAIVGIKNLQLYEEQEKMLFGSIKALVTMLDSRIPREYTHSPYFSRLVVAIANQMHLDEKQVESLKYASLLHDAGKIDIPLHILTKTTKLTPQEYRIIKSHPLRGARILRHLQNLRPVIPIILHHHEKYDGTGYPSRLKKGQIPLGARIMAVADAFEAMVYGRPYRERMSISGAVREIKRKINTQFDPKVVEAFLKVVNKIKTKKYLHDDKKKG